MIRRTKASCGRVGGKLSRALVLSVLGQLAVAILAQDIRVVKPTVGEPQAKGLEAEQVEIHRMFAAPRELHRSAGAFLLILDNETGDRTAKFVIDPGDSGEGILSSSRLLLYDDSIPEVKHRKAGLLDLRKGTYYLKSADKGHILCTITVD